LIVSKTIETFKYSYSIILKLVECRVELMKILDEGWLLGVEVDFIVPHTKYMYRQLTDARHCVETDIRRRKNHPR